MCITIWGQDPRNGKIVTAGRGGRAKFSAEWCHTPNILWYIVNVLNGRMPATNPSEGPRSELVKVLLRKPSGKSPINKEEAYDLLYPHSFDIGPIIVLLCLKTGLNFESVLTLERNCLEGEEGNMTWVRYVKSRGSHETLRRKFSNRGANSPVGIIKLALKITERVVSLAEPPNRKYLFLCHLQTKGKPGVRTPQFTNHADVPEPRHLRTIINGGKEFGRPRLGFVDRNNVRDRDGNIIRVDFRITRKTKATNEYLRHGNLANVSRKVLKHHGKAALTTSALHYLSNDATAHVHNAAVRNAQDKVVEEARLAIISLEQLDHLEVKKIAIELDIPEPNVRSIIKGDQDVFIASCRDFFNKPGGKPNTACNDPWSCFACPNGLWTPRILPRLIKFLWFMEEQRNLLSSADWWDKFNIPYRSITKDILPRFQPSTLEWAKLEAKNTPFYVPTGMREF